jgi:hypothetical protein
MAKCVFCGAETALYIVSDPVCGACDGTSCSECTRLQADYERSVTDLRVTVEAMRGRWDRFEYEKRRRKSEEAQREAESTRDDLERHRRTHAMSANLRHFLTAD